MDQQTTGNHIDNLLLLQTVVHYEYQLHALADFLEQEIGHTLANARQELKSALPLIEAGIDAELVVASLQALTGEISISLQQLQSTVDDLRTPPLLDQLGLAAYLAHTKNSINEHQEQIQINGDFPRFPTSLERMIYRALHRISKSLQEWQSTLYITLQADNEQPLIIIRQKRDILDGSEDDLLLTIADITRPLKLLGSTIETEISSQSGLSISIILPPVNVMTHSTRTGT